jgi:NAD(P)-dependent dehydrogenase (short-subunit alcohol dehydrogenase family)
MTQTNSGDFPEGATVVFGGSGGIGAIIAEGFAEAGSDVAVTYHSKAERAQEVVERIKGAGRAATALQVDVREAAQVEQACDTALETFGGVHTVVFAAGPVVEQKLLADTEPELWQASMQTEMQGFLNVTRAFLPALRKSQGSFVHIGSAGDRWWPPKDGLSVVPKAANEALVRGIAKEEGVNGVRANSVLVGVIEAGMFLELLQRGVFDEDWIRETQKLLALKRWGKPEDIANAAVFLASKRAGYITGEQLNVSGGFGV